MRRGAVWILVFVMLFSTACAESTQKAPDYLMEGYDGKRPVFLFSCDSIRIRTNGKNGNGIS